MILFNPDMQKEKIIAIGFAVIIVAGISGLLLMAYGEDILKNLLGSEDIIENGDYVEFNYIAKYASNGLIFETTYNDTDTKTGGTPLKFFVSTNTSASPGEGYEEYSNLVGIYFVEDFVKGLNGLKAGDEVTISSTDDGSHGVLLTTGDLINLTPYFGITYELSVNEIQEGAAVPEEYADSMTNQVTDLYMLRENWHYIGEIIDTSYTFWTNSTEITQINETLTWTYTTPTTAVDENFTWSESYIDTESGSSLQLTYPTNKSSITSLNDTHIVVTHNVVYNDTIEEQILTGYGLFPYNSYKVESVADGKINVSYTDYETQETGYKEFNSTTTIERNQTTSIIQPVPYEILDNSLLKFLRDYYDEFTQSTSPYLRDVIFEVEIVKVHKAS